MSYMYNHILFIYMLGCFHSFTTVNYMAMNIDIEVFIQVSFSFPLGIYLGVKLLDCMLILCSSIWVTTKLFHSGTSFYIPISNSQGFQFFQSLITFVIFYVVFMFIYSHPSRCEVLSYWVGFILQLPNNK